MQSKKVILFISPNKSQFIQNDLLYLKQHYKIITNQYQWSKPLFTPLYLIHQCIVLLLKIWTIDKIIIHFGGYWSLLPTIFGKFFKKAVIIICHGTDCSSIPSLNYGSLRKKGVKFCCRFSYKYATIICPVSQSLYESNNQYHNINVEQKQGLITFFPKLKTPIKVIPNGLDYHFWITNTDIKKNKNSFLAVFSEKQFFLKGGDLIYEMANNFPNYSFEIGGTNAPQHLSKYPKNLKFLGRLSQIELRDKYYQSEFYFQLSHFEGFGLSLCEAMLCQCIPIGSSVNMIPEIISEHGFILEQKNSNHLKKIIEQAVALSDKKSFSKKAQKSIIDRFSIQQRNDRLLKVIQTN